MKNASEFVLMLTAGTLLGMMLMFMLMTANYQPTTQTSSVTNNITMAQNGATPELIQATNSVVMIYLDNFYGGGSGTIIGRTKVDENTWRYRILTAYHVMDSIFDGLKASPSPEDAVKIKSITIGNRNGYHSQIKLYHTTFNSSDWAIPSQDWIIFNVDIDEKLPCATLGTREDLESVMPYENVYGVGADRLRGIFIRDGFISSFDLVEPFHPSQSDAPWDKYPELFFRPFHTIHFGASGGPIFTKNGRIIGIYNAVGVEHTSPFTVEELKGMAIALKTFVIQEALANTHSTVTLVEN